jgi:hypothetical protein
VRIELNHDFACSAAELFALFLSDALEDRIRASSTSRREDLEDRLEGPVRIRKTRIRPSRDLPGPLKKALGPDGLSYVQTSRFDPGTRRVDWRIDVDRSGGRADITGVITLADLPAGGCRRTVRADIVVRLPLVGGTVEEHVGKDIRRTYERSARLLEDLVKAS